MYELPAIRLPLRSISRNYKVSIFCLLLEVELVTSRDLKFAKKLLYIYLRTFTITVYDKDYFKCFFVTTIFFGCSSQAINQNPSRGAASDSSENTEVEIEVKANLKLYSSYCSLNGNAGLDQGPWTLELLDAKT